MPTFDFAIIQVTEDDEIPFPNGRFAKCGPAFITRRERGGPWGGTERELKKVANQSDIARLVLLDTWTRNCDRYSRVPRTRVNRDNVFLSSEGAPPGRFVLKAIDHTHCFDRGPRLSRHLVDIGNVRAEDIYGCFPEFRSLACPHALDSFRAPIRWNRHQG
jgi:hypothetical protein